MSSPKYLTKQRIANVSAALVIVWTFSLWTFLVTKIIDGGITITSEAIIISPAMAIVVTVLGMMNGFTGFAAKFLWDQCGSD